MHFVFENFSVPTADTAALVLFAAALLTLAKRSYLHVRRQPGGRWEIEGGFNRRPAAHSSLADVLRAWLDRSG